METRAISANISKVFESNPQTATDGAAFQTAIENAKSLEELKSACEAFESFFVQKLFNQMRQTSKSSGFVEKSMARETFEKMLDEELSKEISSAGGIGLADMLFKNMKKAYTLDEAPEPAQKADATSLVERLND
ncbi:rod-binding protein [Fusibacter sp. JL298sf-3]